ncbi:MAG TPA: PorV/PorQ family protein [Rubricoccaceae bacterium]|jgi:hypothetical protein
MRLVPGLRRPTAPRPGSTRRYGFAVAVAVVLAAPASAQTRRDTGFDLAQIDVSARTAAFAGAMGGLAGSDPTVLFSNPAFLTAEMDRSVALGYVDHLTDISAGTAVYARSLPRFGVDAAASVRYFSFGDFERTGTDDAPDGTTYGAGEAAVTLTASRVVAPRVRVGVSAHALFATIDDASAQALTADIGATYEVPSQGLVVGATLNNRVGTVLSSLGETEDRLPVDLRVSVAKRLRYVPLTITVVGYELQHVDDQPVDTTVVSRESFAVRALDHVLVGGELRLGRSLAARAGYSPRRGRALRSGGRLDLAGLSAGFGLTVRRFALDYAYTGWSEVGGLHQIGVRTRL